MLNIDERILESGINPYQFYLLCHIAKFVGRDLSCFPSNAKLCKDTGWGITRLNEVKKSLVVDGYLKVEQRFNANKQTFNLYTIETDTLFCVYNLKGKGGSDTPVGIATPTDNLPCRDSDTPPVGIATTEVLTNEVLDFNNKPAFEKFEHWAKRTLESKGVKAIYKTVRGLDPRKFGEYYEKWLIEASETPEQYTCYRDVSQHFLNYAAAQKKIQDRDAARAAKNPTRPEAVNPNIPRYS